MKLPEVYLIEKIRPEAGHILDLLPKAPENKKLQNYYNDLAQWGTQHLQKAGAINLDKIKLSYKDKVIKLGLAKHTKDLWSMIDALINLMKKPSLKEEDIKVIQQTTLEILAELSKKPIPEKPADTEEDPTDDPEEPEETPEEFPEDSKTSGKRDWTAYKAKKLADAKKDNKATSEVLEEFYKEYYSVEYAELKPEKQQEIIDKLKSLDKLLIPEFNSLGYNPEVNPFAQYLKSLIKNKYDIFEKLTLKTYGAIHNSFIAKYITGNMLGNYDIYKDTNILFCSDLYNNVGLDIVEYLALQRQTIDAAKNNSKYTDDKDIVTKIFIQQPAADGDDYSNKVKKLIDELKHDELILPWKPEAKMRSMLEIQELYKYLFKAEAKKPVNAKAVEEILTKAINQDVVRDILNHILRQDEFTDRYVELTRAATELLNGYQSTKENIEKGKKILSGYIIDNPARKLIVQALKTYIEEHKKAETKS